MDNLDDILKEIYRELSQQRKEITKLKECKPYNQYETESKIDLYFKVLVYILFIVVILIALTMIIKRG